LQEAQEFTHFDRYSEKRWDVGGTWVGGNIPTPPDMVVKWGIDFFVKSIVHFYKMQKIS